MSAIQEIVAWSKKLPLWQSDALRRIFTCEKLSPTDEDELLKMLLASHGVALKKEVPSPIPFSEVVKEAAKDPRHVVLKELHSLENVNAIVPDQSLKFAMDGLTVIYGENGAGKSGYARVLKHACHARDKGEPILPNVANQGSPKPSAVIELLVDGEDVAVRWQSETAPPQVLADIAVFDTHCARVFIDEANEVVYLPYGLDVFAKLAALCKSLKDKIAVLLRDIPIRLPVAEEFSPTTAAGRLVTTLAADSNATQLETLSRLEPAELDRLQQLREVVATAKANSPKRRAAEIRRVESRFQQLLQKAVAAATSLSLDSLEKLREMAATVRTASQAAELASSKAFADEPIPATGAEPWRVLFEAARTFSEKLAYPDEQFPVTREGSVCVLCQQPLSEAARRRFERFQEFVQNEAAKRKAQAEVAMRTASVALMTTETDYLSKDLTLLDELKSHDEALATNVAEFFSCAAKRKEAATAAIATGAWGSIPELQPAISDDLKRVVSDLEAAAVELDKADSPEELRKLEHELLELEDRFRLQKNIEPVKEFIRKKKLNVSLRACDRALDTTAITRFGSELMERAVTERLKVALRCELKALAVQSVPLNIRRLGDRGKTKHQLTITAGTRPSRVLSEGEQRVVAIACFLAELSTSSIQSPIIFDDPVSSLDHLYREQVAKRLVTEAKERQVVVFTHDIVMLLALERECGEQRVALQLHTVRRTASGPGECPSIPSRPWHACKTKDRIGILKNLAAPFRKKQAQSQQEYERVAADLYGKLRETWERAVEEVLLQDVVQRFRPSVETLRLKAIAVEPSDYVIIDQAMGKCSTWMTGHDSAAALGSAFPPPAEIDHDIATLETFLKTIKERSDRTGRAAAALVDPPQPQLATQRATKIIDTSAPTPTA